MPYKTLCTLRVSKVFNVQYFSVIITLPTCFILLQLCFFYIVINYMVIHQNPHQSYSCWIKYILQLFTAFINHITFYIAFNCLMGDYGKMLPLFRGNDLLWKQVEIEFLSPVEITFKTTGLVIYHLKNTTSKGAPIKTHTTKSPQCIQHLFLVCIHVDC